MICVRGDCQKEGVDFIDAYAPHCLMDYVGKHASTLMLKKMPLGSSEFS
jgi:hypothetical protein